MDKMKIKSGTIRNKALLDQQTFINPFRTGRVIYVRANDLSAVFTSNNGYCDQCSSVLKGAI